MELVQNLHSQDYISPSACGNATNCVEINNIIANATRISLERKQSEPGSVLRSPGSVLRAKSRSTVVISYSYLANKQLFKFDAKNLELHDDQTAP